MTFISARAAMCDEIRHEEFRRILRNHPHASPHDRTMQCPSPTASPFFGGRDTTEPAAEGTRHAWMAQARDCQSHGCTTTLRSALCNGAAVLPFEDQGTPLPARKQARFRDRDLGARSATAAEQTTRTASPAAARRASANATPPERRRDQAAHRAGPLLPSFASGDGNFENLAGNRFGGCELCATCAQPHTDANYVATDADGVSYCGDCWNASLGVTVIVRCTFGQDDHLCECGNDLRYERWFAAIDTPTPGAYCKACCLSFWGFNDADMTVSAIEDSLTDRTKGGGGAHLHSSTATPNDDTSPCAGLFDRGFSNGPVPSLLEGCMNLSPRTGESRLPTACAHTRRAHTPACARCRSLRAAAHSTDTNIGRGTTWSTRRRRAAQQACGRRNARRHARRTTQSCSRATRPTGQRRTTDEHRVRRRPPPMRTRRFRAAGQQCPRRALAQGTSR